MDAPKPQNPMSREPYPLGKPSGRPIFLRLNDPAVLDHIARIVIRHNMDYSAAVGKMLPKATTAQANMLAETLSCHPQLLAKIQEHLHKLGIDDASLTEYFSTMWTWLKSGNDRLKAVAARQLGDAFCIGQRRDDAKHPQVLPIKGVEEGVKRMLEVVQ